MNCDPIDLKNPKYKIRMLQGIAIPETKSATDLCNLDIFLENEKINNATEPWSKLNKTAKIKKLLFFAEKYGIANSLTEEENELLIKFLKDSLNRNRFQRVKDLQYDKITGEIKDIPALFYNRGIHHFTLKNIDKRVSTIKSLGAKKKSVINSTLKNTHGILHTDDGDSDNECEHDL